MAARSCAPAIWHMPCALLCALLALCCRLASAQLPNLRVGLPADVDPGRQLWSQVRVVRGLGCVSGGGRKMRRCECVCDRALPKPRRRALAVELRYIAQ